MSKACPRIHAEGFMRRALALAGRGQGFVSPNPCVGAVLTRGGEILAEGHHERWAGPHAEVACLNEVSEDENLQDATLFVTLEPCAHTGKTPPCADLILRRGVGQVVVAMQDPNPLVAGRGIARLREAGVQVQVGLLQSLAERLNRGFIKSMQSSRPWVTLKWAATLDGRISQAVDQRTPISGKESREELMRLRVQHDAILVGIGTSKTDDPLLLVPTHLDASPLRFVVDPLGETRVGSKLGQTLNQVPVHLLLSEKAPQERVEALAAAGFEIHLIASSPRNSMSSDATVEQRKTARHELPIAAILDCVRETGANSLLVEGGAKVHGRFLQSGFVDELIQISAPTIFGQGPSAVHAKDAACLEKGQRLRLVARRCFGEDQWQTWRVEF
jgi:diaminohydroxyphosphoribosylaminopyrimidine deaminase / 5-amino-6-(5-phosphoribosylamino)uracil reductase